MEDIRLISTTVNNNIVKYSFSSSDGIKKYFDTNELAITYDQDMSDVPVEIMNIPFISLMLPVSWITNSIIWVEKIDYSFYQSIFNIKRAYQAFYPTFSFGGTVVSAYVTRSEKSLSDSALVLYSGGLDSISTFLHNKDNIKLLCNIFGWIGSETVSYQNYKKDINNMVDFAHRVEKPLGLIESNFACVINNTFDKLMYKKINNNLWYGMQHSMMFISIAIPYAVKNNLSKIYIASSNTIGFRQACASDPTTDIEFEFLNNGYVIHDGFELSRQEKVRRVVDYQRSTRKPFPLQVCSFNDTNCCECEKCFRTILGIVAEGADVKDFGFEIKGNLKDHFVDVLSRREHLLGLSFEARCYWDDIKARMKVNYDVIKEKEFVDWFLTYDFVKGKKHAVYNYRKKNFLSLIKKRLMNNGK